MHLFEAILSVSTDDTTIELRGRYGIPWADFVLNPRRLRGSDFLMRWSQGVWSEERLVHALDQTSRYFALPYGPSGTAPSDDIRAFELYFERLEEAGLGQTKRPDLLVFRQPDYSRVARLIDQLGGIRELPFTAEANTGMQELLSHAILAVECENSLWKASQMPDYGSPLRPMRRLAGQVGLRKGAVVPTVILKEEDRSPLLMWQEQTTVPIHIWHVFYDMAFGLALNTAEDLIRVGKIEPVEQVFQAPGGATSKKVIYKIYYHYAYSVGMATEQPNLVADFVEDKNGHILPYVRFQGGSLQIDQAAIQVLDTLSGGGKS